MKKLLLGVNTLDLGLTLVACGGANTSPSAPAQRPVDVLERNHIINTF